MGGGPHRGTCRSDGTCECHPRWGGPNCCEPEEICPDDFLCYHGVCNDRGHCDCDPCYTGDDCSLGPFCAPEPDDCETEATASGRRACAARRAAASFLEADAGLLGGLT